MGLSILLKLGYNKNICKQSNLNGFHVNVTKTILSIRVP